MNQIICIPKIEDREQLASLKNDPALGVGVNVVYIYFLLHKLIPYPKRLSNILYIGEAMREKEPTGVRFRQHITPSAVEGADTGSNFVLSQYFHAGWDVGLAILSTGEARLQDERSLIYAHIADFGAPPIAQGKIPHDDGGKNCTTHIANFLKQNSSEIAATSALLAEIVAIYGQSTLA